MSGVAALDGIDDRDIPKMEFLSAAFSSDHEKIVKLMENGQVHIDSTDDDGVTALHIAAAMGNNHLVRILLNYNANIEAANQLGMTAFHHASREGKLSVIDTLLQRGANYSKLTTLGVNALTLASAGGHADVVKKLLSLRVEAMKSAPRNRSLAPSPLIAATCFKSSQICNYLTRAGAQIDETIDTLKGLSALSTAIICDPGIYMVTSLLDLGANQSKKSLNRATGVELAKSCKRKDILHVFYEKREPINTRYDIRQVIAEDKVTERTIDQPLPDGSTLLMFATTVRSLNSAKLLLEMEVDVNAKDNMHITALQIASLLRVDQIIQLLLVDNARTTDTNKYGLTAYDLLLHSGDVLEPGYLRAQLHCHRPMQVDIKSNFNQSGSILKDPKNWFKQVSSQVFSTPSNDQSPEAIKPENWLNSITHYQPSKDRNQCKFACVEEILRGTRSARRNQGNTYDMVTDAMRAYMEECQSFLAVCFCDSYGEREEKPRTSTQDQNRYYDIAHSNAQSLGYNKSRKLYRNSINLHRRDSMDSTGSLMDRRKPRTVSMVDAPSQNQSRTTPRMIKKSRDSMSEAALQSQYGRAGRIGQVPTVVVGAARPLRQQVVMPTITDDTIWSQFLRRGQQDLMVKLKDQEIDRYIFMKLTESDLQDMGIRSREEWQVVRDIQRAIQTGSL